MAAADASAKDAKVFDVAKPGNTPPSETSRPTIVGHKPMSTDPMVNKPAAATADSPAQPDQTAASPAKPVAKIPVAEAGEKVIAPLTSAEKAVKPAAKAAEKPAEAPVKEEAGAKTEAKPAAKTDSPNAAESETTEEAGKTPDHADKKPPDEPSVDVAHAEELIAKKQYFVPIGQSKHASSSSQAVLTGLLLGLLVVIGLAAAWDAGYIDVGVKPPFDFITDTVP